jgi:xanthine phosphoribosyltransferase
MKYYPYEEFRQDSLELIREVKKFQPEMIVGIARGGLILAHSMAEGLDIRDVQTIRTELYDKTQKREEITLFGTCDFANKTKVLVVDDIADSGKTLDIVMKSFKQNNPHITFKVATLFYKKNSVFQPDFWVNEANEWIDFFWERDFKEDSIERL